MISIENQTKIFSDSLYPKKYKVVLLNDDYTPFDFVIFAIKTIFYKNDDEAYNITMKIHEQGQGVCGEYTLDVAITKMHEVQDLAQENEYPLKAIYEEL